MTPLCLETPRNATHGHLAPSHRPGIHRSTMTHAPPEHGSESTPPILLELNGVHWTMQNKSILTDIQLSVSRGDWVAIVGPNGAGKSSLLRCCLGWKTPTQGDIRIHGQPVSQVTPKARAAKMAWLPQHTRLSEPMPVRNVVANARYRFSESQAASLNAVGDALSQMHLERLSNRCWTTLSGGEQQRVNLAALIAQEADIWLLDEPANHLDPTVQQSVLQHLYELWQRGQTLVMIPMISTFCSPPYPPNIKHVCMYWDSLQDAHSSWRPSTLPRFHGI